MASSVNINSRRKLRVESGPSSLFVFFTFTLRHSMFGVWTCTSTKSIDATFDSRLDDSMKIKALLVSLLMVFVSATVCLSGDTKLDQALRDADAAWSKAAGAKDLDKTVSYYADDAMVMPPNSSAATTKDAIRNIWKDLLASPGLVITWKGLKVEVAKSGEIGFITGTYQLTMNDATGKPIPDHGKYVEVWEKQKDGKWKCVADIWNSDLPVPGASSPAGDKK